jgi:thiamine-monophosphate kinase
VKVSELGEFGLIELINNIIDRSKNLEYSSWRKLVIGIGDDVAVWKGDNSLQLLTTDCLIENVHFDPGIVTWAELGWKAIAVNISDIAAMGGIPAYALVSLALPGEMEVDCISQLYQGMVSLCDQHQVAIVGGNISSSDKTMITITLLGSLKGKSMLTRSEAKTGDLIAITGYTGLSAAGLHMLKQGLCCDADSRRILREAHLKPVARVTEGLVLLQYGVKTAIDISDGLISDLIHICKASHVGALIEQRLVPVHPVLQTYFKHDYQRFILAGGEDYELLFTAPGRIVEKLKKILSCPITIIGKVIGDIPGEVRVLDYNGEYRTLKEFGWEHFKSKI